MIRLIRPDDATIAAQLARTDAPFNHADVGATARPEALVALAHRYIFDHSRFPLGRGDAVFERAREALFAWRQFEIPWLELCGREAPVLPGRIVATLTRVFGLWFLSPCRVVDRIDPPGGANEVSFAYGTLAGHVACGEERFSVRRNPETGDVVFEIFAFSRPAIPLVRIGRPFMRGVQARFRADSAAALQRAIAAPQTR